MPPRSRHWNWHLYDSPCGVGRPNLLKWQFTMLPLFERHKLKILIVSHKPFPVAEYQMILAWILPCTLSANPIVTIKLDVVSLTHPWSSLVQRNFFIVSDKVSAFPGFEPEDGAPPPDNPFHALHCSGDAWQDNEWRVSCSIPRDYLCW